VPALHINSWYDFGVYETLVEFRLLRTNAVSDRARNNQFAVISRRATASQGLVQLRTRSWANASLAMRGSTTPRCTCSGSTTGCEDWKTG